MALAVVGILLFADDHGQCDRRCSAAFGFKGERSWTHPGTCVCKENETAIDRLNPPDGPKPPGTVVCGTDGVTYPDEPAAKVHTSVLHAGPCGACSNESDIAAYRRTASTLTGITENCAVKSLLFGEAVGSACLSKGSGLSPKCVDCWVDNMSCTAVHCLGTCMLAKARGSPRNLPDGRLNDCLACDESYCGGPFIRCAGANRRRAGILSDIERPKTQVWGDSNSKPP